MTSCFHPGDVDSVKHHSAADCFMPSKTWPPVEQSSTSDEENLSRPHTPPYQGMTEKVDGSPMTCSSDRTTECTDDIPRNDSPNPLLFSLVPVDRESERKCPFRVTCDKNGDVFVVSEDGTESLPLHEISGANLQETPKVGTLWVFESSPADPIRIEFFRSSDEVQRDVGGVILQVTVYSKQQFMWMAERASVPFLMR